jgi:hypothetical protein
VLYPSVPLALLSPHITQGLLLGIAGSLPIARVKFVIAVVEALLALSHGTAHVWIGTALAQVRHLPISTMHCTLVLFYFPFHRLASSRLASLP